MDWKFVISSAITLGILLDPLGNAPVVQGLLQDISPARRVRVLMREMFAVLALLLLFFVAGRWILGWLGITNSTLKLAGGTLLFLTAIGMVFPATNVMGAIGRGRRNAGEPFIVPVAVPLIVGPAALSIVMLQASSCASWQARGAYLLAIFIAWGVTAALLLCSQQLLNRLGDKGAVALLRLMGMLLVLLAVQMFLDGVTEYIASL